MSVGHLYGHMDYHNWKIDHWSKMAKEACDKVSIGDTVSFYMQHNGKFVTGEVTKKYNWYLLGVTDSDGKRYSVAAISCLENED